jgi:lysozyme
MKPRHHISRDAIELIKRFEGYRRNAAQLPGGGWTIGYGHTRAARQGAEVSPSDAEALLIYDLLDITAAVNELTFTPLTQNQFDALVCLAFSTGLEAFRRSVVLRRVNEGDMLGAAASFEMWRKADFEGETIIVDALVRRRAAEKALFLTPADGYVPSPSPILRPKADYTAAYTGEPALNLVTVLDGDDAVVRREDETPVDDVGLTATEVAAETVTARLRALLPELPTEAEAAEPGAEAIGFELTPEPEEDARPAEPPVIAASAPNDEPTLFAIDVPETPAVASEVKGSPFDRPSVDLEPEVEPEEKPVAAETPAWPDDQVIALDKPSPLDTRTEDLLKGESKPAEKAGIPKQPLYLVLLIVGVAAFISGAAWGVGQAAWGLHMRPALGWLVAMAGVVITPSALYLLLQEIYTDEADD